MNTVLSFACPIPEAMTQEQALVLAAKNGDGEAFELLFKRLRHKILAIALRYTRTPDDAEDVVQLSFQKAFVNLHTFEGKSSFSTWLTRIAINESLMFLRRSHSQTEISLDCDFIDAQGFASGLTISDSYLDPETTYLRREAAGLLRFAMSRLRPDVRRVIELRDLKECSTKETAKRMGTSVSAAKANLFRGRKKLRQVLKRHAVQGSKLSVFRLV
jgi:RNA polymerase sigma-70 factor, ECF subfamily